MHFTPLFRKFSLTSAAGAVALLSACGGGGDAGRGTLQVSLTDAPSCGYDNVYVTVSKVRVHQSAGAGESDAGWQEIVLAQPKKIDLLTLTNGVLENLGEVSLPAGRYTQMRLVLGPNNSTSPTANSVVVTGNAGEVALETPSAIQSGIKLNHSFDVAAGSQVSLVLDFDACKSIVTKGSGSGGYALKPVINVIPATTSGGISGYVPTGLGNALVSAQQNGVVVKSTVPDAQGQFTLSPLPPDATGYVVVVSANGSTSAAITGVPVTTGTVTQVSSSAAPIAVTGSGVRSISGTASPPAAQPMVRATQTYSSGPKVEVAFKLADMTSGTYALSVPTAAPLIGAYGTGTLPIALSADTAAAGKYAIEASATGYATQSANIDVSATDATQSFTLVPSP